jgi:hypothetical protein
LSQIGYAPIGVAMAEMFPAGIRYSNMAQTFETELSRLSQRLTRVRAAFLQPPSLTLTQPSGQFNDARQRRLLNFIRKIESPKKTDGFSRVRLAVHVDKSRDAAKLNDHPEPDDARKP